MNANQLVKREAVAYCDEIHARTSFRDNIHAEM